MSTPVVECEHGIRQYVRRGVEQLACACHVIPTWTPGSNQQMPRLDMKERPVDWPWLYGRSPRT